MRCIRAAQCSKTLVNLEAREGVDTDAVGDRQRSTIRKSVNIASPRMMREPQVLAELTRPAWIAQRLVSSKRPTRRASTPPAPQRGRLEAQVVPEVDRNLLD